MAEAAVEVPPPVEAEKPVESNEVLTNLDNAKISMFHFKAIVVAGMGFFTDAYDLFSIGLLTKIIGRIYFQDNPLTYIASTYGSEQNAPWWGITDEAGVNQPFGNGQPQSCATVSKNGRYCASTNIGDPAPGGSPLQYTNYSYSTGLTTTYSYSCQPGLAAGQTCVPGVTDLTNYLAGKTAYGCLMTGQTTAAATTTCGIVTPSITGNFNDIAGGYAVMMTPPLVPISAPTDSMAQAFGLSTPGGVTLPTGAKYNLQYYSAYNKGRVAPGALPINLDAAVSSVALCGTLAGQLFFGWAGDAFGRKAAYGLTLAIMVFCAAAQSMSFGTNSLAVIGTLCWWRFFLGFGVGGDYPLSATIMSEYSSRLSRGAFVGAVFAMQGVGILTAAAVVTIVTSIFNGYYPALPYPPDDLAGNPTLYWSLIQASCPKQSDFIWRVVLGFGAVPAGCTAYLRATLPETPRYTLHVKQDKAQLAADMTDVTHMELDSSHTKVSKAHDMSFGTFLRKHGKELLGCAMTWFLLDVAFYSQGLFQKTVFLQIGWLPPAATVNAMTETFRIARAQALIALGSTIPGYYFTVFTVDFMGRLKIQYMGFALMTTFMAAISGAYDHLLIPNTDDGMGLNSLQPTGRNGFVVMYALCFFFANWGPNATTFVIPAELFPTKWKSTGHGISAASGKAGAIIGAFGFLFAAQPAKNELTWKFPCVNSQMFPITTFQWNFVSTKPNPLAGDGPYQAATAYLQNLAIDGASAWNFPGTNVWGKPPFKSSAGYGAMYPNAAGAFTATTAAGLNATGTLAGGVVVPNPPQMNAVQCGYALNGQDINGNGPAGPFNGNNPGTATFPGATQAGFTSGGAFFQVNNPAAYTGQILSYKPTQTWLWNTSLTVNAPWWMDPADNIINQAGYGFPQIYPKTLNVVNFKTATALPANTTACLVKPNCPGGTIATPAINNGYKSYKCVCPIPAPLSGCFPYGIGIQGALGILAGTNFLGMLFTLLVPETMGKTLEELNGELDVEEATA